MRMVRYMAWVLVASLTVWSVGCGGASAPEGVDDEAKIQEEMEAGGMTSTGIPQGQQRELGKEVPESMQGGGPETGGAGGP